MYKIITSLFLQKLLEAEFTNTAKLKVFKRSAL